jgi:mono/diheme cytochrome c family protein
VRRAFLLIPIAAAGFALSACGTEGIEVSDSDPNHRGAELFAQRCSGCHTLQAAGAQGSSNRSQRAQGPNLDGRKESYEDAIYAIRNGGFSGAIMPQNIVVGEDAEAVARFLEVYSGKDVEDPLGPGE